MRSRASTCDADRAARFIQVESVLHAAGDGNVSALSAEEPSEASKTVLRRLGLLDRFDQDPAAVVGDLHQGLKHTGDKDRLLEHAGVSEGPEP